MVTVLAVGFLLLDAALLGAAGLWDHRPVLLVGAGACLALAGAVLVLRRRYARTLREIAAARARLREELRAVKPRPREERGG